MWKMKILSCMNLGAKLKNPASEQGPLPPAKAVALTPGTDAVLSDRVLAWLLHAPSPNLEMTSVLGQPLCSGELPPPPA